MKGTILVVLAGLYLTAGAILVIGNLGTTMQLWMFAKILESLSTGLVLLVAAGCGAVAIAAIWMLVKGAKSIRRGHLEQRLARVDKAQKDQAKQQAQGPASSAS